MAVTNLTKKFYVAALHPFTPCSKVIDSIINTFKKNHIKNKKQVKE